MAGGHGVSRGAASLTPQDVRDLSQLKTQLMLVEALQAAAAAATNASAGSSRG